MAFEHSGQATTVHTITGFPLCSTDITPHDTNPLVNNQGNALAMHVVVFDAGNIVVIPAGNADADTDTYTVSATAADAGFALPVLVRRVLATGTTATVIKGYY